MKEFIVKHENKQYKVKANDYNEAISAISAITVKDSAGNLETINALIEDERAAVDAYNVALKNLEGKIPADAIKVITAIRDDENRHIENLQAVVNGNITEKNFEDSIKDDATDVEWDKLVDMGLADYMNDIERYNRNGYDWSVDCTSPQSARKVAETIKRRGGYVSIESSRYVHYSW